MISGGRDFLDAYSHVHSETDEWINRSFDILSECCDSRLFRNSVATAANLVETSLSEGALIVTCGNGGSSAEASHFAAELTGRFARNREPFAAFCISDSSYVTCAANDFGYEQVFARVVQSLVGINFLLVCFSTSGESKNVVNAAAKAKSLGNPVLSFCGQPNSSLSALSDVAIEVQCNQAGLAQQIHQTAMHAICARLDHRALSDEAPA